MGGLYVILNAQYQCTDKANIKSKQLILKYTMSPDARLN